MIDEFMHRVVPLEYSWRQRLPALELLALINNSVGADGQDMHRDASERPAALGVKVQIPLVDVDLSMGPLCLYPLSHVSMHAISMCCAPVFATVYKGSAILYSHALLHHGTANTSPRHR